MRTQSQNCEQTLQKLRTNRIMNKRAFLIYAHPGVTAQTLYLLQGCGIPPPLPLPPPLKKFPISEPHNHLRACCTRLASQGASRHWHPDHCHLLLLAAAAAHEEFYEQQLSKRSRFQLTSPCQSVKSRRGWEEGDGTENVMSCRQVTLYDAL